MPRLPQDAEIVEASRRPTFKFQRWWQSVVSKIETTISDLTAAVVRLTAAEGSITTLDATLTDHIEAADPHPQYVTHEEGAAAYQPLDSDLSEIAALATTAFGRGVLTSADAASLRSQAGIGSTPTGSSQTATHAISIDLGGTTYWILLSNV